MSVREWGRALHAQMGYLPLLFAALTGRSGHDLAERPAKSPSDSRLFARPLCQRSPGTALVASWVVVITLRSPRPITTRLM